MKLKDKQITLNVKNSIVHGRMVISATPEARIFNLDKYDLQGIALSIRKEE
jgi:hypothetical protein